MRHVLFLLALLSGCGATPEQLVSGVGGLGVASIAIIQRSPFDAVYSAVTGRDCSVVRLDRGQSYCRPVDPLPETPVFCTRSLGVVDCWKEPWQLPGRPKEVADGPSTLTPAQDANRTRRWPF